MVKKLNCLVSAGPTREWIDPVRFISNPSSGKMGYALAREAMRRGYEVNLVSGPVNLKAIDGLFITQVETAEEMRHAMLEKFEQADLILMCAAVSDHRPVVCSKHKKKKTEFSTEYYNQCVFLVFFIFFIIPVVVNHQKNISHTTNT